MPQIEIYTDGSCETDTGKGGWGVLLLEEKGHIALSGHEDRTTSNRMEVTAAIKALEAVPEGADVKLLSDSQYLVHTMTRNWKRKANLDLWERLDALVVVRRVGWEWLRGHNAHPGNEFVNALAGYAAGLRNDPPKIERFLGLETQETESITRTVKLGTVQDSSILSHQDEQGRVRMVDVGRKPETERIATACGVVKMRPETLALIQENGIPKGDVFAAARNIFGGRSDATQKVLNDLRETCLYELKALAYAKGADAVIAIDLDYSEFSGGMLFLVASGTAVKLKE